MPKKPAKTLSNPAKMRLKIKREVGVDLSQKELNAIYKILIGPFGRIDRPYISPKKE